MQPNTITIAMMKSPDSRGWLAQIHLEYQGTQQKDVLPLKGDNPIKLLAHCSQCLQKKLDKAKSERN